MLMPKKNRVLIYEHLFKEGVMVAKKDFCALKHNELEVPNLHVIKALQSLKSRGYVKEQFAWRHYYWYLTNDGIQYLRDFLHLPPEIVPATLKRQATRGPVPEARKRMDDYRGPGGASDRDAYRKTGTDKTAEAGAGARQDFQYRAGFGRGRPAPQKE